jgi:hypothetical protein
MNGGNGFPKEEAEAISLATIPSVVVASLRGIYTRLEPFRHRAVRRSLLQGAMGVTSRESISANLLLRTAL